MSNKYTSSCRACLAKVGQEDLHSFVWTEIKELFMDCTSIEIPSDDCYRNLPLQICSECLSKCEQWHTFKRMCHDVNDHLMKTITSPDTHQTLTIKEDTTWDIKEDDLDQYTFGELVADTEEECEVPLSSKFNSIPVPEVIVEHPKTNSENIDDSKNGCGRDQKHQKSRKPVECPVCKKVMALCHLAQHFVIHTTERPHVCSYCNADFKMKHSAKRHVKEKHPGKPMGAVVKKRESIFHGSRPWEAMGYFVD